jgi:hypothetical protein
MQILTNNGKHYIGDYCGVSYLGMLKMQVHDQRRLPLLAAELDGCKEITAVYTEESKETFTDFSYLNRIERVDEHSVVVLLSKEAPNA